MTSENFRSLLNELGLTPEEFSNKLGTGKSGIYKILRGETKKISDKLSKKISEVFPQYTYEDIKNLNYSSKNVIKLKEEGQIEVQKIVDIITDNYEKFILNDDFKALLKRNSLNAIKEFKELIEKKK